MSTKRRFCIPQIQSNDTIIFLSPIISSSNYVGGLRPAYQQKKFFLKSSTSSSIGIHMIDSNSSFVIDKHNIRLLLDKIKMNLFLSI